MNLDDRLDRARDELADEVAADVRVPSFAGVLARRAHRRRLQATVGGVALVVVAAGVVGGVAATRPGPHRSVAPAATVSASPPPTASAAPTAPSSVQTYPATGSAYVVVPDGDQLAWTDLKTGAHGHFGPADGSRLADPSVSVDGRRIAYLRVTGNSTFVDFWDLDTRQSRTVIETNGKHGIASPSISPDGSHFAWYEQGSGISITTVEPDSESGGTVVSGGDDPTWMGNGAVAYLPQNRNTGGDCAVERIELSPRGISCLLPTATLQSVFASDGSTWQVDSISSASDTASLALGVTSAAGGAGAVHGAIGILDSGAEATPFHVLLSSVVDDTSTESVFSPVLLDRGTRVLYVDAQGTHDKPGDGTVVSLEIASGAKTTITTGGALGMSATGG